MTAVPGHGAVPIKTLRVVHIITSLDQGGAEAMLERLVLVGRRLNPEIEQTIICLRRQGVVGERLARAGIRIETLALNGLSPRFIYQLRQLRGRLRPAVPGTIVQTWLWHADLIGGLCARAAGNPRVVWNLRNAMPQLASTKRASRLTALLCARLSKTVPLKIVCNSEAALRAHVAIGYDARKCVIIPNGFELRDPGFAATTRAHVRSEWGAEAGAVYIGMVARVAAEKDHATFIAAAAKLAATVPKARFVLIGFGVTTDATIAAMLSKLSLQRHFVLQERRDDVSAVMGALDVFCLASKTEGFPNVLGEAMACGTPVVASDVGDVREIIGDDRFVAPVADATGLATCLLRVVNLSGEERGALGLAQRERIAARYDIEQVWRQYLSLYLAALDPEDAQH
jgi:glycosyltransferase involved in cell wall biosynthesis